MDAKYIIAQAFGIMITVFAVISFQQKTSSRILVFQFLCDLVGVIHFSIMSSYTGKFMGAVMYGFAILRAVIFYLGNKYKFFSHFIWVVLFCSGFVVSFVLGFTVFGMEPSVSNIIIEALPVTGSIVMSVGFNAKKAKTVRLFYLIGAPLWLVYGIFTMSIGETITEAFNIVSIIIGLLRLDRKGGKAEQPES